MILESIFPRHARKPALPDPAYFFFCFPQFIFCTVFFKASSCFFIWSICCEARLSAALTLGGLEEDPGGTSLFFFVDMVAPSLVC